MAQDAPYTTYVDHLRRGRLAYQFSVAGQCPVFFPRTVSPHDIDEVLAWRVSRGLGTVYSTTAIARRDGSEYNVALVDCDEGFRLMSRVEDIPAREVRIGMRVQLRVVPGDGADEDPFPVFVPAGDAA